MKKILGILSAVVILAPVSSFSYDVGDAMMLLEEQRAGLVELLKKAPATVTDRELRRAAVRCEGAELVLDVLVEKKGAEVTETDPATGVTSVRFVPGTLTPEKIAAAADADRTALLVEYAALLVEARTAFAAVNAEISVQTALQPADRSFAVLGTATAQIAAVMRKGHKIFR